MPHTQTKQTTISMLDKGQDTVLITYQIYICHRFMADYILGLVIANIV